MIRLIRRVKEAKFMDYSSFRHTVGRVLALWLTASFAVPSCNRKPASETFSRGETSSPHETAPTPRIVGRTNTTGTHVIVNQITTDEFPIIRIFASVLEDGQPVRGVSASEFRVREDEVDQELLTVERELPPLSVVLTLDTSGSMKKSLAEAQAAAVRFIDTLAANDSVQIVSFADEVRPLSAMITSRKPAKAAINSLNARGNTALYDALHTSLSLLQNRSGRKAVVFLTDGYDDDGTARPASKHKPKDVFTLARQTQVPVNVISIGADTDEAVLGQIAAETGGLHLKAPDASYLEQLYVQLAEQLSAQCSISYTTESPAEDGSERTVVLRYYPLSGSDRRSYTPPSALKQR